MGLSINDSVYSSVFFFLTGLHFFHLVVGLLLLSLLSWSSSFSFRKKEDVISRVLVLFLSRDDKKKRKTNREKLSLTFFRLRFLGILVSLGKEAKERKIDVREMLVTNFWISRGLFFFSLKCLWKWKKKARDPGYEHFFSISFGWISSL